MISKLIKRVLGRESASIPQADGYSLADMLLQAETSRAAGRLEGEQEADERAERLKILAAIAPARVGHQEPRNIVEEAVWIWECFDIWERERKAQGGPEVDTIQSRT